MIAFKIAGVPTLFVKAFTHRDVGNILEFVREARAQKTDSDNRVLFIDTPVTGATVEAVERLAAEGYSVFFRDHHALDGQPTNDRERQVFHATARLRDLLGDNCLISVRRLHPACSTLVGLGEFEGAVAIIADPDADGLTAAMKAAGISYEGLDDDAAKLDSEPSVQVTGSPLSQLLAKGLATLPTFTAEQPHRREQAQLQIFRDWVAAVQGDSRALARFEERKTVYDLAVQVALLLARTAQEVAPGVILVDVIDAETYDAGTLSLLMEQRPGCRITVVRKDKGPIAALHGIQYSLAVAKSHQKQVNLQLLVPPDVLNDPKTGIISNVNFLLHVSEEVWQQHVLPGLRLGIA